MKNITSIAILPNSYGSFSFLNFYCNPVKNNLILPAVLAIKKTQLPISNGTKILTAKNNIAV